MLFKLIYIIKQINMEQLPTEIIDKIIFPKYYKPNNQISNLNEKLIIGHNFNKLEMVNNQIKSIYKEYIYKTGESESETTTNKYHMLKNISFPKYILMKNLSKKNKSIKNKVNLCNKIIQFYTNTTSNVCYYNSTNINNNLITNNSYTNENFISNYINNNINTNIN